MIQNPLECWVDHVSRRYNLIEYNVDLMQVVQPEIVRSTRHVFQSSRGERTSDISHSLPYKSRSKCHKNTYDTC